MIDSTSRILTGQHRTLESVVPVRENGTRSGRRALTLVALCLVLFQAGCASVSVERRERTVLPLPPAREPPPVSTAPVPDRRPLEPAPEQPVVRPPRPAPVPSPPAVIALMNEANRSRSSGELDTAAVTLERAIRIQPRNPLLWHELASIRLQQHQPGLAEDLAKKSNILASGDPSLVAKNWTLIAEARRMRGDAEGAAAAERKAGR